jgi:hypothetical protein
MKQRKPKAYATKMAKKWLFLLLLAGNSLGAAVYDVRQFGAVGDGRADDQRAIQGAADAASRDRGSIVFFPAGQYRHTGVIDFRANTTVEGSGADSMLIATTPGAAAIRFADAGNCAIRQLKIESAARSRLQNDEASGLLFKNSHDCVASNLWVEGAAAAGINVHGSNDIVVHDVEVKATRADGIHVVSGSHRVTVSNNQAYDTGDDSFSAVAYESQEQTDEVTFDNNLSVRSAARGVACIGADHCVISHNKIFSPAAHGIAVAWENSYHTWHPHHALIEENLIRDVATPGMNALLLDQAADVQIGFNEIHDSNPVYVHGSTEIAIRGIELNGSSGTALIARDCQQISIKETIVRSASDSAFLLERVSGGEVAGNTLIDVQMKGDAAKAAIEVLNSGDLTGSDNKVQHSDSWKGVSYGPIRVIASPKVAISVDTAGEAR